MPKQLSVGSEWIWLDTASPGLSETNVSVGNLWLNTLTNNLFVCKDATIGAQVWDEYPTATVAVNKGGTGANSLTAHSILLGNGTSAINPLAVGVTGTVLAGSTGADPLFTPTPTVTSITFGSGNALSSYTEQTSWTPVITGTTAAGVGTYTTQTGQYTRIGNMIFLQGSITWTAHTGTGNMTVTNLPFTCRNTANYNPEGIANPQNITLPGGGITTLSSIQPGTSTIDLYCVNNAGTNLNIAMSNAGTLHITHAYLT